MGCNKSANGLRYRSNQGTNGTPRSRSLVAVGRSFRRPQVSGSYELVGMIGRASTDIDREGTVFVRGEFWHALSREPIRQGERVEIEAVDGLILRVRSAAPQA